MLLRRRRIALAARRMICKRKRMRLKVPLKSKQTRLVDKGM